MLTDFSRKTFSDSELYSHDVLAIAPSWHCDAHCIHCFIPFRERREDRYDKRVLNAVLSNLPEDIKVISITGGEPFLHPERLLEISRLASRKNRHTAVVTNGLWFAKGDRAHSLLRKLYFSGMRGISISIDTYHRPRISFDSTIELIRTARTLGMAVNIRGAGRKAEKLAGEIIKSGVMKGQESPTYLFGIEHAGSAKNLPKDKFCGIKKNDNCILATKPFVLPNGDVLACCAIRALETKNEVLRIGNVLKEPLDRILSRAKKNYAIGAIIARGPSWLIEILGVKLSTRGKSRCQVCLEILNNPKNVKALTEKIVASKELRKDIAGRMLVWEKCYRPELLPQFQGGA